MPYKNVDLPIRVPEGDFCWDSGKEICAYFDNYESHPKCILNIASLHYDNNYIVKKPSACSNLKTVPDTEIDKAKRLIS